MRWTLAVGLLLLLAGPPALAQTAETPVTGAANEGKSASEAERMTRVLVLGDSVGGGLGAGLMRMGDADGHYEVTLRFNDESGLARPEVYDWAETLPKILESGSYDVIVVLLGANDRQMIRSGNERLAFSTPDWIAAYKRQADRVLGSLKASGARIYWVSIPPMADADYDAAMRIVTGLQKERVEAMGFTFIDIRPAFSNAEGGYTDTGPDETGVVRKLRGRDGVSFFKWGNNRLAQLVLQAIETGDQQSAEASASPAPSAPEAITQQVPLFGQTGAMGEAILLRPDDVTVSTGIVMAAGGDEKDPAAVLAAIRTMVPKGSAAEKLFTRGETDPVPKGRADDFAAPLLPAD